ncbi:hypothetical protein D3C78_1136340 [compost metagenome]
MVGKLANKPPTQQSIFNTGINQNTNVTSVGLIYTQQFDSFKEFLQKITGKNRRDEKKKKEESEKKAVEEEKKSSTAPISVRKDAVLNDQKKLKKK